MQVQIRPLKIHGLFLEKEFHLKLKYDKLNKYQMRMNLEQIVMTIVYEKLVRDRIPEIIEQSGKTCRVEVLSDWDYLRMIDAKLDEELAEYHKDQNLEELADLIEVIYAAAQARGFTLEQLEAVRAEKAEKRGCFAKKLFLKEVTEHN